ncbi:aminotransferase class III-fold pyridoxal phosphate-dependent enzyme [Paenibacillus daejeonensis]|uniref:aminotransferase class III-fold pyridoxal phosphate-dependent enzyme n=1 Tax=Paenibacillus daejeonensis TaxID=135193 RepID=UPI000372A367|nr:aminotransferase class III-fold pyridoxal phosphate-dependent enzyme [Paenibacillus daejeonensis]
MKTVKRSLAQLLGQNYMDSVVAGAAVLKDMDLVEAHRLANEEMEFMPQAYREKMDRLLSQVGQRVIAPLQGSSSGAPTDSFRKAANPQASPLGGLGYLRLGEDGRLYLAAKSEHYHIPLGHNFPGYQLIDRARQLGITNATHNNTRGHITRLLERELIRTANGLDRADEEELEARLSSRESHVLNRVINLDTGSLACEAGIKMMLARFYKLEDHSPEPLYKGRTPVFFVIADNEGKGRANYHGTTVIAQTMRGLWPELYDKMEAAGILQVCPVNINDIDDFRAKLEQYNRPPFKTAGFIHEIIMMNYGGIKLERQFLQEAYELCHAHDTPVMCDEIQSCMWYPGMFLFRAYGLDPDFVIIGKGFPGGEYSASRILTTHEMDTLSQFGALVTNGQEELAALAYLITMCFAEENAAYTGRMGEYYETKLRELAARYPSLIMCIEGSGHLATIFFHETEQVVRFTEKLNGKCIDISSQTYKAQCPPTALTKPPIIATTAMLDYMLAQMDEALMQLAQEPHEAAQA